MNPIIFTFKLSSCLELGQKLIQKDIFVQLPF